MRYVKVAVLTILVVVTLTLLAGCTSPTPTPTPVQDPNRVVKPGDNVTVDYIGSYINDTVFDTSVESAGKSAGLNRTTYAPITFTVGTEKLIKGFDEGVVGMKLNETKVVIVPPEKGYGLKIVPVNLSSFTAQNVTPEVNDTIYYTGRYYIIDSIDTGNGTVYLSAVHPLAGETLKFTIILRSIN
jgi:FKBP-type peptidyl-prolyl cis-trans isomerase 2